MYSMQCIVCMLQSTEHFLNVKLICIIMSILYYIVVCHIYSRQSNDAEHMHTKSW